MGGIDDRRGKRWLCFDIDGTRQAVIQRSVPRGEPYVGGARRTPEATAPGYTGRRRGDAVRTRVAVQQAHTSEWLGVFGAPGNGSLETLMESVLGAVSTYLGARCWPSARTLLRFDGEHGRFPEVHRLVQAGMGFVIRGVVYSLLDNPQVRAGLAAGTTVRLAHPDTGVTREVFDVPGVTWKSGDKQCTVRLIVTRSRKEPDRPVRIGKLIAGYVYEIFVTTADPACFHAADIVSMYLHRGQFEATLAQEDRELPADRWISYSPDGEEIWQIVCQWVWNLELWLGRIDAPESALARTTDFTPEIETLCEPVKITDMNDAPGSDTEALADTAEQPTLEWGEPEFVDLSTEPRAHAALASSEPTPSRHANGEPEALIFQRDSDGTMRCPTGQPMCVVETRTVRDGTRQRFQVSDGACAQCTLRVACRGANADSMRGRRINAAPEQKRLELNGQSLRVEQACKPARQRPAAVAAILPDASKPTVPTADIVPTKPAPASTSIRWNDLRARSIRTKLEHDLESLKVQLLPSKTSATADPLQTERARDRRAHRRHTWLWSIQHNAMPPDQSGSTIRIHGISARLAHALGIPART